MKQNERELTAFCGLYCGDCIRYKCRASDLANELLHEIDKTHFTKYAHVKRTHMEEFENLNSLISLLKVISEIKCSTPCRSGGDGCGGTCEIKKCALSKKFEGCWECNECEQCNKFEFLKPFHGNAPKNNLRKIKQYGLDTWSSHREQCYPWLTKK